MALTDIEICNNALDLIGQGLHFTSFDENRKEADACKRLYKPTLERLLDSGYWSFARKTALITDAQTTAVTNRPYSNAFSLPDDCLKVLYILPKKEGEGTYQEFERDYPFDYRIDNGAKIFTTEAQAPFYIVYQALVTDTSLFTPNFTASLEMQLAVKLASELIKGVQGLQTAQALIQTMQQQITLAVRNDVEVLLPFTERAKRILHKLTVTMSDVDVPTQRKLGDACYRLFDTVKKRALDKFDWTFSRTDEVITGAALIEQAVNLPYNFTYTLPDNFSRAVYIVPIKGDQLMADPIACDKYIDAPFGAPFKIRLYDGKRVLCTNLQAPFSLQYIASDVSDEICPPTFLEAVETLVASEIAPDVIDGEAGLKEQQNLLGQGLQMLNKAHELDVPVQPELQYPFDNRLLQERYGARASSLLGSRR